MGAQQETQLMNKAEQTSVSFVRLFRSNVWVNNRLKVAAKNIKKLW